MLLAYGVVLGEPALERLFPEGSDSSADGQALLDDLPVEIDPDGAVYGDPDEPGGTVVGCKVIELRAGEGCPSPLPLAKLERHLREDIKNAKRRWKGLAAWVAEKSKGKIKLGKPSLVLVLED